MIFSKKRGFTLLEVIVSIAILLIVIVPISTALIVSTGTNKKSSDVVNGTKLAQEQAEDIRSRLNRDPDVYNDSDLSKAKPLGPPGFDAWTSTTDFQRVYIDGTNLITDCNDDSFYTSTPADPSSGKKAQGQWAYRDKDSKYVVKCSVVRESSDNKSNFDETVYKNKIIKGDAPYEVKTGDNRITITGISSSGDMKSQVITVKKDGNSEVSYNLDSSSNDYSKDKVYTIFFVCDSALESSSSETGNVTIGLAPGLTVDELDCVVINDFKGKIKFSKGKGAEYRIAKLFRDDVLDEKDNYNKDKAVTRDTKMYSYEVEVYKIDKSNLQMKVGSRLLARAASQKYVSKSK